MTAYVQFHNYTARTRYYLLTDGSGCPSADFSYPYRETGSVRGVVLREWRG